VAKKKAEYDKQTEDYMANTEKRVEEQEKQSSIEDVED